FATLVRAPCVRFLDRPQYGRHEAFEPAFEQVVGRTDVQAFHRLLFDHRAGDEDHGYVRLRRLRLLQRGDAVVARQVVVRDDEIEGLCREGGFEAVLPVGQQDGAGQAVALEAMANELGVAGVVLEMEDAKGTAHASLRLSLSGTSLRTAQNALTCFTASTKS